MQVSISNESFRIGFSAFIYTHRVAARLYGGSKVTDVHVITIVNGIDSTPSMDSLSRYSLVCPMSTRRMFFFYLDDDDYIDRLNNR